MGARLPLFLDLLGKARSAAVRSETTADLAPRLEHPGNNQGPMGVSQIPCLLLLGR